MLVWEDEKDVRLRAGNDRTRVGDEQLGVVGQRREGSGKRGHAANL